jgi:hypothetical protein
MLIKFICLQGSSEENMAIWPPKQALQLVQPSFGKRYLMNARFGLGLKCYGDTSTITKVITQLPPSLSDRRIGFAF